MFKKNVIDAAVASAMAEGDEVLSERNRIEATIAKTSEEVHVVDNQLESALEQLAMEEADVALAADNGPESETAAQRKVQKLRSRLEAQHARLRGLARRLTENEERLYRAQDALTVARDAWMRARSAEFDKEYKQAVATLTTVLRKGIAIGDALDAPDLSSAMRQARLCDPQDLTCSMIDLDPVRTNPLSGLMEHYPAWEDDPAARAVYESLSGVRLAAESLNTLANRLRQRREEAARKEERRRRDASPRPKTASYEVYYPPEYGPVAAVEVVEAGRR